jgi:hypothetical protein
MRASIGQQVYEPHRRLWYWYCLLRQFGQMLMYQSPTILDLAAH